MKSAQVANIKFDWKKVSVDGMPYEYIVENTYGDIETGEKLVTVYQANNRICEYVTRNLRQVGSETVKKIIRDHYKARFNKNWPTSEGWYWVKYKGNKYGYVTCPAQYFIFAESKVFASAKNDTFILSKDHEPVDKSLRIGPRIPLP